MIKRPLFLLLVFSLTLFYSCNTQKKAFRAPIKEEGADFLFSKLKENELKYSTFSSKFSADYENGDKKNSFSGQIRIRKDSLIWISISAGLGIEVLRMMISQDSVQFINRINNTYFIGDYNIVNRFLNTNIDYDILQSFLTGNDLSFYENGKFRASLDKDQYKLSTAARMKLKKYVRNSSENERILIQNIWIDPETFKITEADVKELTDPNNKLEADYSQFDHIGAQYFPKEVTFDITADNEIHVKVNFSKIATDLPLQFPFKIPQSYRQVK
ncbi:MAG TPA: DUF4292 domain-containing protein [Bacteroidales bacterium]|nr:DUF4292 domain-containing protein [Bacteroidales bacterium]